MSQSYRFNIECEVCGDVRRLKEGVAVNVLCQKCKGSSALKVMEDPDLNSCVLKCAKCGKIFLIIMGQPFDTREFKHCRTHCFLFLRDFSEGDIPDYVNSELKKPDSENNIISMPLSAEDIATAKQALECGNKIRIAIVNRAEMGHVIYPGLKELAAKLREKYIVRIFAQRIQSQKEFAILNECDLAIGAYTQAMKYAVMLRVPSIILHTEVKLLVRGEVSLYGLAGIKLDGLLEHIEKIVAIPNLTYCVVTYNKKNTAIECIEAVMKWKRANEDIMIVDNCSIDGMGDWLRERDMRENITVLFNDHNTGCIKARNLAMRKAKGRYLMILDSDQVVAADTMHIMRLVDADIVGTEAWDITKKGTPARVNPDTIDADYVGAGGMLVSKFLASALEYFDEGYSPAYYEDPDFCLRAKRRGYTVKACKNNIDHKGPGMDVSLGEEAARIKENSRMRFQEKWKDIYKRTKVSDKPRILFLIDVPGWAWDIKTKNIQRWLKDEYDIEIRYQNETIDYTMDKYDICFAYDCVFVRRFIGVEPKRIIAGVTAHTYTNFPEYKRLLGNCAAVHANSMMLFEEVRQINAQAFYTPNGVDVDHFSYIPRLSRREFTAGYVGKGHSRKGYRNYVMRACNRAEVKLTAQTSKYNELGKIDPYDMPKFYQGIDCVVIASDMDGTPNQLLEAAAVGRTFVGVRIGNVPEFHNKKNGFLVERDVEQIAEKLVWLKTHRKECERMGWEARKTVEQGWTWEMQSRNYAKMFKAVLERI
jgi:GT2 family glycosyltransferase